MIFRGPSAIVASSKLFDRLASISYHPDLETIFRVDYDHHAAGTSNIAMDKMAHLASETVNKVQMLAEALIEECRGGRKPPFTTSTILEDLKVYRRDFLTRVRAVTALHSITHMLAVPPLRRLIGTQLKRIAIASLLGLRGGPIGEDLATAAAKAYASILESLHAYMRGLARLARWEDNRDPLVKLPGGFTIDKETSDTIGRALEALGDIGRLNYRTYGLDSEIIVKNVKLLFTEGDPGDLVVKHLKWKLSTYLLKYKLAGSLLGTAIVVDQLLESTNAVLDKLVSEKDERQGYDRALASEALEEIQTLADDLIITMDAFATSVSFPFAMPTFYKLEREENGSGGIRRVRVEKPLDEDIVSGAVDRVPCCLFEAGRGSKLSPGINYLLRLILIHSAQLEFEEAMEPCLNVVARNEIPTGGLYIWSNTINYVESDTIVSAFMYDILNSTYTDLNMGYRISTIDVQHDALLGDRDLFGILFNADSYVVGILDNALTKLTITVARHASYYSLLNLVLDIDDSEKPSQCRSQLVYAVAYYNWLHDTLQDNIASMNQKLGDIIRKLGTITGSKVGHDTGCDIDEILSGKKPAPIHFDEEIIYIIEYIRFIVGIACKITKMLKYYNEFIGKIGKRLEEELRGCGKGYLNTYSILEKLKGIRYNDKEVLRSILLAKMKQGGLGKVKQEIVKRENPYNYLVVVLDALTIASFYVSRGDDDYDKYLKLIGSYTTILYNIMTLAEPLDESSTLSRMIMEEFKGLIENSRFRGVNVEDVFVIVPLAGVIKSYYHSPFPPPVHDDILGVQTKPLHRTFINRLVPQNFYIVVVAYMPGVVGLPKRMALRRILAKAAVKAIGRLVEHYIASR